MVSTDRRRTGAAWEATACAALKRHGLIELARNIAFRFGELDLVMRERDTIVFVEVRYRAGADYGGGVASVDAHKRRRIVRAAAAYLVAHPALARAPCRFDVVALSGAPPQPQIEWIRDAFRLDDA